MSEHILPGLFFSLVEGLGTAGSKMIPNNLFHLIVKNAE